MDETRLQEIYASSAWIMAQAKVNEHMHAADRARDPVERDRQLELKAEAIAARDALLKE